jgi:hypothetical protein
MKYYEGKSTGKGFITHEDNEVGHIKDIGFDLWMTENWRWAHFRGLDEISAEDAQLKIDLAIYGEEDENGDQIVFTLPTGSLNNG